MIATILPIKHLASAKQRLDVEERADLMREMVARVLGALGERGGVFVVTGDPEVAAMAREHGAEVVDEGPLRGHSGAASLGIAHVMERGGVGEVLLLAGDCPLLTSRDVSDLLRSASGADPRVVIAPDRHGTGTNALVLSPPTIIKPAFGPGSRVRHEQLAREAGARVVIHESTAFAHDVDTVDDLEAIDRVQAR